MSVFSEDAQDIEALVRAVRDLREAAEKARRAGGRVPAVNRNTKRILSGVRMLELEVTEAFVDEPGRIDLL